MSLKAVTPPLGQTGPLAEIAKKETSNNKLLVAGITLLVISLFGLLVGLGLVICGLTQGTPFFIAGASIIGTSLLGIGIAALLIGLAKHRSQQLLQEPLQILEKKPLVSSKEEDLKNQLTTLKTKLQEQDRIRDEEQVFWLKKTSDLRSQIKKLNTTLENVVCERTQQSSENARHLSAITGLQQKNRDLKSENQTLVTENKDLKSENECLEKANEYDGKMITRYMLEQQEIRLRGNLEMRLSRKSILDPEKWLGIK